MLDNIKTVIFDMDGIIFDSERVYIDCCVDAAVKYNLENVVETCYKCIGITSEMTKKILLDTYGDESIVSDWCHDSMDLFQERYSGGRLPIKLGAEELLSHLKEKGLKVALASSTAEHLVREQLTAAGLIQYFDRIVTGDMVERSKPNPDIFLKAAELTETDPAECVVIEDSFNGVRAGHAAGMYVIMVPDLLQPDDEIRSLANTVQETLLEVKKLFK